jgi:hypothetical protein
VLSIEDGRDKEHGLVLVYTSSQSSENAAAGELWRTASAEEQRLGVVRCSGGARGGTGQTHFYRLGRPREWGRQKELVQLGNGYDGHKWGFKVH